MKTAKKIRLYDLLILGALTSVSLLSSCQKKLDTELSASDGMLRFEVSDTPQWQAGNVAASKAEPIDSASLKVQKIGDVWEDGQQMYLHTSVEPLGTIVEPVESDTMQAAGVATKGAVINQGKFHNTFGIMAMAYAGDAYTSGFTPTFMYNVQATGGGQTEVIQINQNNQKTIFSTTNTFYIPHGKNVALFAYAPYKATSSNETWISLPNASTNWGAGRPKYTVEVPLYLADQKDICFAEAVASGNNGTTNLNFEHAMAAVRFDIASTVPSCTLKSISLKNVSYKGTVEPNATKSSGWWTTTDEKRNFTYNNGNQGVSHSQGTTTNVFGVEKAFFMIPQGKEGITLEIVVQKGSSPERTLTTTLPGNWSKGNKYNYTLSFSPEDPSIFEIRTPSTNGVTWQTDGSGYKTGNVTEPGGTYTFNITSHKNNARLNYKVEYRTSSSDTWKPLPTNSNTLLISQSNKAESGTTGYVHTFKVYQQYTINNTQNSQLKSATPQGSSTSGKRLDFNSSGSQNTANCYIVKAPGYYSFGAIYGNAIKNSGRNTLVLSGKYQDYQNNPITAQNIQNIAKARVLWTDVPGLISEIKLSGSLITFRVPQSNIQEGNAVIGVFDPNEKCIWSWHIWVTPENLTPKTLYNVQNKNSPVNVLLHPIGYVNPGKANWRNASLQVRFVQATSAGGWNEATAKQFTISQTGAKNVDTPGRYPVYQWGRKDPLWPMAANKNGEAQDAPVYPGPDGSTDFLPRLELLKADNGGTPFYGDLMKKPHLFYGNVLSAIFTKAYLWDASVEEGPNDGLSNKYNTQKSIYDPSPAGYKIAPPGTFDTFAHNGSSYLGGIATPNPLAPSGGWGKGWNSALNIQNHDNVNKIVYFRIAGGTSTFPIPLLGCRVYAGEDATNNFVAGRVGTNFFTWETARLHYNWVCAFGVYIGNSLDSWIDLYGAGNLTTSPFNIQSLRNAYPVLPVAE